MKTAFSISCNSESGVKTQSSTERRRRSSASLPDIAIGRLGGVFLPGRLSLGQLFSADEAFFTGTASEVTPIREVDGIQVGHGSRGEITEKLQSMYFDLVHGRLPQYSHFLTSVYDSK